MSRRGNCWDNAPQESFFGHMKDEIDYKSCETIEELKKHQKPFVVVLNTKTPYTLTVKQLTKKLQEMYKVTVMPMDCASMDLEDISQLMKKILFEFPVCQVDFETPGWFDVLELSSPVKKAVIEFAQKVMNQISCMRDAKVPEKKPSAAD